MASLLVTADSGITASTGTRQTGTGSGNELFSSTLNQEMQQDSSASDSETARADNQSTVQPKPVAAARHVAGQQGSEATEAPQGAANNPAAIDSTAPAQALEIIPDINSLKPLQDDELQAQADAEETLIPAFIAVPVSVPEPAKKQNSKTDSLLQTDLVLDESSTNILPGNPASEAGILQATTAEETGNMGYLQSVLNKFSRSKVSESSANTLAGNGKHLQDSGKGLPLNTTGVTSTGMDSGTNNLAQLFSGLRAEDMFTLKTKPEALQIVPGTVLAPEIDISTLQNVSATSATNGSTSAATSVPNDNRALFANSMTYTLQSELHAASEGWSEDLGAKITWLSHQKIGKAEISLHPAELGALDITIDHDHERITVSIVTRNDAARELLESSMPKLAELLRNNGLSLEQGTVSQQSNSGKQNNADSGLANNGSDSSDTASDQQLPSHMQVRSAILHNGQIDHYV